MLESIETHNEPVRCTCGRLLARRLGSIITVRCKRCKRIVDLPEAEPESEVRCSCRRLLARGVVGGLELSCPRCKQLHVVPYRRED